MFGYTMTLEAHNTFGVRFTVVILNSFQCDCIRISGIKTGTMAFQAWKLPYQSFPLQCIPKSFREVLQGFSGFFVTLQPSEVECGTSNGLAVLALATVLLHNRG